MRGRILAGACLLLAGSALAAGPSQLPFVGTWTGSPEDGSTLYLVLGPDGSLAAESQIRDETYLLAGHYSVQASAQEGSVAEGVMTWFGITAYPRTSDSAPKTVEFKAEEGKLLLRAVSDAKRTDKAIVLSRSRLSAVQLGLAAPESSGAIPEFKGSDMTKAALVAFGLPGAWAVDCARGIAPKNTYSYYQVPSDGPPIATTVFTNGHTRGRVVAQITDAEMPQAGMLRITSKLVSGGTVKNGTVTSVLYRDGDGLGVWSSHYEGTATAPFGRYKAGDHVDQDGIFMGHLILPDGRVSVRPPARHRCGDGGPPPGSG